MPEHTPSPIDLPDAELDRGGIGWTSGILAIASLFLLLTNGVSLRDWIDDQPPSPLQARASELADQWLQITTDFGVAVPRERMHAQWKRAEQARFETAADQPAAAERPD